MRRKQGALRRVLLAFYRLRGLFYYAAALMLVAVALTDHFAKGEAVQELRSVAAFTGLGIGVIAIVLIFFGARIVPARDIVVATAPVTGRWLALNSPGTKVPSHGVRMYGQAYAIDLVLDPGATEATDARENIDTAGYTSILERPAFGGAPAMRDPSVYPAFGEPVFAMVSGEVVRATGWRRDHRTRSSILALFYLLGEGAVRELGGPGFVLGNHVTIRSERGVFAVVGHLQRGSLAVRVGDLVCAGQQIARCGNSGNSTEPHVHAQLMDRASPWTGQGVPMAFDGFTMPVNGDYLEATPATTD